MPATATYTVLRPIFMGGVRQEVGDAVQLTALQYAELKNAGKVGPHTPKPAAAAAKAPKAAAKAAAAPAPDTTTTPPNTALEATTP